MASHTWPDHLQPPDPSRIETQLARFWAELLALGTLIDAGEQLLCSEQTATLRAIILELMVGLNGIAYPTGTHHLNTYLGPSQRAAIEKTLVAPSVSAEAWIGQAVSLVVIYRWYAPQLVERFGLHYPADAETEALGRMRTLLPDWPQSITTG
ncbi:MAG: hypothetical protein IPK16_24065 [Anaerolineales bacterium]|nr:hypothetical protein [Anaerolineales bacterium]